MSSIALLIELFINGSTANEELNDHLQNLFKEFSSYLTLGDGATVPTITPIISYPSESSLGDIKNEIELLEKFKREISSNLLLVGIFHFLLETSKENRFKSTTLDNKGYLFVNYEPKDSLKSDERLFSLIILNEFVNYLFSLVDKSLETHLGKCFRNINNRDNDHSIQPISTTIYLSNPIIFCSNCSNKILESFSKLDQETLNVDSKVISHLETLEPKPSVEKQLASNIQPNLVQQARKPPPRRIQELHDPNSDLSFAQRKMINTILHELNILKEPLEDMEYLETRQRFFDGKISEQVFLQILKRKAK